MSVLASCIRLVISVCCDILLCSVNIHNIKGIITETSRNSRSSRSSGSSSSGKNTKIRLLTRIRRLSRYRYCDCSTHPSQRRSRWLFHQPAARFLILCITITITITINMNIFTITTNTCSYYYQTPHPQTPHMFLLLVPACSQAWLRGLSYGFVPCFVVLVCVSLCYCLVGLLFRLSYGLHDYKKGIARIWLNF